MTTQSKTTTQQHTAGPDAPGYTWSLTAMLRRALRSQDYDLAVYAFQSHGLRNVRGYVAGKNSAKQIAAMRFLLRRCPLALTNQHVDVARHIGAAP